MHLMALQNIFFLFEHHLSYHKVLLKRPPPPHTLAVWYWGCSSKNATPKPLFGSRPTHTIFSWLWPIILSRTYIADAADYREPKNIWATLCILIIKAAKLLLSCTTLCCNWWWWGGGVFWKFPYGINFLHADCGTMQMYACSGFI